MGKQTVTNEEISEKKYIEKLSCSKSTKKLIMQDCIKEFLRHHPELKGMNITQNIILRNMAEFYLKE